MVSFDIEMFYALLPLCGENPTITGGIISQKACDAEIQWFPYC